LNTFIDSEVIEHEELKKVMKKAEEKLPLNEDEIKRG
jgi:hypothetical protein